MDNIEHQLSGLTLQNDENRTTMIYRDMEYLGHCYVMNITEIDFSQNPYLMCNTMEEEDTYVFPSYQKLYNTLEHIIKKQQPNIFIDKIKLFTYLDYYHEHFCIRNE